MGIPSGAIVVSSATAGTGVQVYAMQLVLSLPLGGLPVGANITVAAAQAGVYNR